MNLNSFEHIAKQLRCPAQAEGLEIGERMNQSNERLIKRTVEAAKLNAEDKVLEIGHGNGKHISDLFAIETSITYTGLDISSLMHEQAKEHNEILIKKGLASFHLYDGACLPFPDNTFNKIFSVNTLYFVDNPLAYIEELERVSQEKSLMVFGLVDKSFMKDKPFQENGFRLYGEKELRDLFKNSPFKVLSIQKGSDQIHTNTGEFLDRAYIVLSVQKY
ncbi:MAG: class I SAM-dependent methyltransferase [Bacteroidota bacterium]